jgi:3-oxoacyl-[acyl-carrier protein] reductase
LAASVRVTYVAKEEDESVISIDLTGKIAVITGASGELGRVMARTLADAGAHVVIHYFRGADRAQALVEELRARGTGATAVQADVTQEASVRTLHEIVVREVGDADVIVNNAVIQYPWKPVLEQPDEDFESQFRSCVMHNVYMVRAFAPAMIKKRWGRVIAINTECAIQCSPTQGAYASAKRALDGLVRVLAKELGPHQIAVNQVAPGWTISDRYRREGTERQPEYEAGVPLGHRGTDQDVANAVAFLASDLAGFITGAYLPVCGGHVLPGL